MENIQDLLKKDPQKAIEFLMSQQKDVKEIDKRRKEYTDQFRGQRDSQIDNTIKNRFVKKEGVTREVKMVRTPFNFQKKIVNTACAFEVGKPVKLSQEDEGNALGVETINAYRKSRMDYNLQEFIKVKKSETESCIIFSLTKPKNGKPRKIRAEVKSCEQGKMCPYFDEDGDMVYFTWHYTVFNGNDITENYKIYTDTMRFDVVISGEHDIQCTSFKHGFDKIPVAYDSQRAVEWKDVEIAIDRYESLVSKLSNSNDYFAHPLLFFKGEIQGLPDKDDAGKVLQAPIKIDDDGKAHSGEARFLEHDQATDSIKLEKDTLKELIYSLTNTPDVSFSNLKGIGNIASHSMELMFLDAKMKALLNEGRNRVFVERCLHIINSGIKTTINTSFRGSEDPVFNIVFESVLPSNFSEIVDNLSKAKESGIISLKTAVEMLGATSDNKAEVHDIEEDVDKIILGVAE